MANLTFPQLSSGAPAQYPLRRRRVIQTALNAFADGSIVPLSFNTNVRTIWELPYSDLNAEDQLALGSHFAACRGAWSPFTFIDPAANMLSSSGNLSALPWTADPQLTVMAGARDPLGGTSAFLLVNSSQIDRQLWQPILAPANFLYCFSLYASSTSTTSLSLGRSQFFDTQRFDVGPKWTRAIHAGKLADNRGYFTVSISVPAAQSILVWGPQLEAQLSPSRYRRTDGPGGVYQNAHYLGNSLTFESEAPGLFSISISIETT